MASSGQEAQLGPEIFRLAMQNAPSPMLIVREDGTILVVNEAAVRLFGYAAAELVGKTVEVLVPEGFRSAHKGYRAGFMADRHPRPMGVERDLMALGKNGVQIPVEVGLSPVQTPAGPLVVVGLVDLSARKQAEQNLAEVAELLGKRNQRLLELVTTDGLTSLKSRRAFQDHLDAQLEVAVRNAHPLSVLILDIDFFKDYNDAFGHLAGDEILRQMGMTLRAVARRSDFVARLGGEEFGIILLETGKEGARVLAERFREAVENADWPRRAITASLGATTLEFRQTVPRPATPSFSAILRDADRALYRSKETGRNRVTHAADLEKGTPEVMSTGLLDGQTDSAE